MTRTTSIAALGLLSMLVAPTAAPAQSVAPFYAGKTVTIVVGAGEGGGYSLYGQLAAEYLRKLLPGSPTVIVQSMPGAGGIKATDYLANVAPKDGTRSACCSISPPPRRCCSRAWSAMTSRNSPWSARSSPTIRW